MRFALPILAALIALPALADETLLTLDGGCLLYTSPSPRD